MTSEVTNPQPNNAFLENLLKCSIDQVNANAKWDERDQDTRWFQEAIYVPTKLDNELLPVLRELKYPLVFVAGTPGSGKTLFLKSFKNDLLRNGFQSVPAERGMKTVATFQKNGKVLHMKHDATQVESEIDDAASKLGELLERDWSDEYFDKTNKNAFYVVGINQGVLQRLCDLDHFQKLSGAIRNSSDPRILVVDLSKRSGVNPLNHQDAFVTLLLLTLTEERHWENAPSADSGHQTCYGCELVESGLCPVLTNVRWLRRESLWERIHDIFEMIHYIPGNVTTFRDVLAILAKAIAGYWEHFGTKSLCEFIRDEAAQDDLVNVMNLSRLLIYNGMFSDKDPYGEYVDSLDLEPAERDKHRCYGFCGSYFSTDANNLGVMALLDPARSDSDELRELDDEIFNFPKSLLGILDGPLEEKCFNSIFEQLRILDSGELDNAPDRVLRWRARDWLLYCLVRLGRRRVFLLEERSCKSLTGYEHAFFFSEAIVELVTGSEEGYSRRLAGDMRIALTGFCSTPESGNLQISHGRRDSEITAFLSFDSHPRVDVLERETHYIEYFPRESILVMADAQVGGQLGQLSPLIIDLEVWECLQRVYAGFMASYLGMERAKTIENFLQGLRSIAWDLQNSRLDIDRGDTRVTIQKDQEGPVIR